ncbi:hypothetical protein Hanom_Chr17g01571661 [Helianthus anomalus]
MNTYLFFVCVGAANSSKSASRFSLSDIQDIVFPRSIKKELAASQSMPESKGVSTRANCGSKRKKPSESSEGLPLIEQQLHEAVSEVSITYPEFVSYLEKESKTLQKHILLADITANKERLEIIDEAKKSAAIDVEAWKQRLQELGDDEEPEEVLAIEAGGNDSKDPEDAAAAGGSGEGGEVKVDDAAKA